MTPFQVHICVGDDSGGETGEALGVELHATNGRGEPLLKLECILLDEDDDRPAPADGIPEGRGPEIFLSAGHVTLHAETFAYQSRCRHVGNLCWDAFGMRTDEIARLLNVLRRNDWDCEGGDTILFEAGNAGLEFTRELLEPFAEGPGR